MKIRPTNILVALAAGFIMGMHSLPIMIFAAIILVVFFAGADRYRISKNAAALEQLERDDKHLREKIAETATRALDELADAGAVTRGLVAQKLVEAGEQMNFQLENARSAEDIAHCAARKRLGWYLADNAAAIIDAHTRAKLARLGVDFDHMRSRIWRSETGEAG